MAKPSRYTTEESQEYVGKGYWKTSMSKVWDRNAQDYPDRIAVEDPKAKLTWYQAEQWTDTFAINLLELGLERDNVVVLQLPNCIELPLLRIACEKAGVLCAPVQANLREKEMQYILNYLDAKAVVIPWKFRNFDYVSMLKTIRSDLPQLEHVFVAADEQVEGTLPVRTLASKRLGERYSLNDVEERRYKPTEVSMLNQTTGTTGFPKFAEYPAGANAAWAEGQVPYLELNSGDVVAAIAPAARGPCLPAYYDAPWAGVETVMIPWKGQEKGAKEALELLESKRVTVACVVPTQLAMISEQFKRGNYDLSSIRVWYSAGAPMPPALVDDVEMHMGGIVISNYGAVDFGGLVCLSVRDSQTVREFTVGKPRFGTQVKIVDEDENEVTAGEAGEVLGKGPTCSSGYYKDAESTSEAWRDGWFRTGDLGKIDQAGNLAIVGRKKDMIIRGGQNIYPAELENILLAHPKVREVAIVGMSDPVMGERVCAYVVPETGQNFSFEEMVEFLKGKDIAPFKIPERLEIMEKLPLVSEQKVDKKKLKQDIEDKLTHERSCEK